MSVLLVTDDVDDDLHILSFSSSYPTESSSIDSLYKQLKQLEHDLPTSSSSSSSATSFSILESSSSIIVKSNQYYRQQRRRRSRRLQPCWVQSLLTYMFTWLLFTTHLHWSILLVLSFMPSQVMTTTSNLFFPPLPFTDDQQQCLPLHGAHIDRICSKTCRAQRNPFENVNQILADMLYLPFCSHSLLNRSIEFGNIHEEEWNESQCRDIFKQLIKFDEEARKASQLFATYLKAIDSASKANRYSIINADCQQAYRTWTCSVKVPYYHRNQRIPPCQTICDEVERVCPTFRPSDHEPLFAGQPLFFCNGGIVSNSDYSDRPHCFDTCHLAGGSLQRHSVSSFSSFQSIANLAEDLVTTPPCFEIEPLPDLFIINNGSIFTETNFTNTSLSSTSIRLISSSSSLLFVTLLFFFSLSSSS